MTINPAGVVLVVLAIAAIIVGVTGSQSSAWQAIFGGPAVGTSAATGGTGGVTLMAAHSSTPMGTSARTKDAA